MGDARNCLTKILQLPCGRPRSRLLPFGHRTTRLLPSVKERSRTKLPGRRSWLQLPSGRPRIRRLPSGHRTTWLLPSVEERSRISNRGECLVDRFFITLTDECSFVDMIDKVIAVLLVGPDDLPLGHRIRGIWGCTACHVALGYSCRS